MPPALWWRLEDCLLINENTSQSQSCWGWRIWCRRDTYETIEREGAAMCFDRRSGGGGGSCMGIWVSQWTSWMEQHTSDNKEMKLDEREVRELQKSQNPVNRGKSPQRQQLWAKQTPRTGCSVKHGMSGCLSCLVNPLATCREGAFVQESPLLWLTERQIVEEENSHWLASSTFFYHGQQVEIELRQK